MFCCCDCTSSSKDSSCFASCLFPENPCYPIDPNFKMTVNRIAICAKEGEEDGVTVIGVVPRGHVSPPYLPLGLSVPATVAFSDCVAIAARVRCDGSVESLGPPRDLPSVKTPPAPRRLDSDALRDAINLYGPFRSELTQEYLALFGVRLLDRPYLMCVSAGEKTLELPFGHSIYRVSKIDWVAVTPANFVSISQPQQDSSTKRPQLGKKDLNRLQHFLAYDWGEADSLLFGDAINVCSVFPFNSPTMNKAEAERINKNWTESQRKDEFGCDWGKSLRQPFDEGNIGQLCSPFTRGFALGTIFTVAPPRNSSVMKPTATTTETTASSSWPMDHKSRLTRFYAKYAPEKVDKVDVALKSFAGKEDKMWATLLSRYGPEPENPNNNQQKQQSHNENDEGNNNNNDSNEPTTPIDIASSPQMPPKTKNNNTTKTPEQIASHINATGAPDENVLFFFMMGTQHSGNPGPRFFGRGLNEQGHAGNDLVYQLVAWKYRKGGGNKDNKKLFSLWDVQWTRHVFLRGTAPIKFKNQVATGIGEAKIVLLDDALDGTAEYLTRQVEKCNTIANFPSSAPSATAATSTESSRTPSPAAVASSTTEDGEGKQESNENNQQQQQQYANYPKLRCINLLKSVSQAGEHRLGALFDQGVKRLSSSTGLPIDIEHIDWLGLEAKFGIETAASRIWHVALLFMDGGGQGSLPVSSGSFPLHARLPQSMEESRDLASPMMHTVTQQQNRFIRYNCADSLDRTNLASFFVVAQLCSKLFLTLDVVPERLRLNVSANPLLYETAPVPKSEKEKQQQLQPLAEVKENLDELPEEIPPETELPPCFYHSIKDFADSMPEPLLQALVELFVTNGDTIAKLFTSTGAIHTSHMRKFVPGMRSASANAIISAQRRFENVFRDKKKYRIVDIIVGKDTKTYHFPSIPQHYLVWPLPRKQWPNALVVKIPSVNFLIGMQNLKKALFPDSEEKQSKVVEIREEILAIEKIGGEANMNSSANIGSPAASATNLNVVSPPLTPSTGRLQQQQQQQPPLSPGGNNQLPPGSPSSPSGLDDDVPRDQENADFSFLTFDRFYLAVVLFEPNSQIPSSLINQNPQAKDAPLHERKIVLPLKIEKKDNENNEIPFLVNATCSYYLYEQATEETVACLRVRKALQEANAASPLVKLSNFAKNLFK